jgi:hypothetical protein
MRISYGLLTQFARAGDAGAMNLLTQWEKHGDPASPDMKAQAHFQQGPGFFLSVAPVADVYLPKRTATMVGIMPAVRERTGTLTGIPAVIPPLGGGYEDVIITDNDGDPDGDD